MKIEWGEALRGACVAAILWEIGRQVLAVYLVHRGYASAYGVIGSFLAIMLWTYYAMLVVFLGAEYTRAVREENQPRPEMKLGVSVPLPAACSAAFSDSASRQTR